MAQVLVIDDDAALRELVADELLSRGFEVLVASNGAEALERLDTCRPAAIVLDLTMPVMNGWSFLERYRQRSVDASVPIVVVSGSGGPSPDFEDLGVRTFLTKPFDVQQLATRISALAEGADDSPQPET